MINTTTKTRRPKVISRHAGIFTAIAYIFIATSCSQPCSTPDGILDISLSSDLSAKHLENLECIAKVTKADPGKELTYQVFVNGKSIGNQTIDQFSYEIDNNRLTMVSWSEGNFTLGQVIDELDSIIQHLESEGAGGVIEAKSRVKNIHAELPRYDTDYRDLTFAIDVEGSRVFVRTVFSYVNESPFVIRYEITN